jgi:hypothetical protein
VTSDIVRQAGPAAENAVFPSASFDADAEERGGASLRRAYRVAVLRTRRMSLSRRHAYDAVQVLVEAARQRGLLAGGRPPPRRFSESTNHDGASGRMAFDRKGDVMQYPKLFRRARRDSSSRTTDSSRRARLAGWPAAMSTRLGLGARS